LLDEMEIIHLGWPWRSVLQQKLYECVFPSKAFFVVSKICETCVRYLCWLFTTSCLYRSIAWPDNHVSPRAKRRVLY